MNLLLVDYITKAIAFIALGGSLHLLITNFEPKSIIIKILYIMVVTGLSGLAMTTSLYFTTNDGLILLLDLISGVLIDIAAGAAGIASLLRLKELLPLLSKFNSNRKAKIFEHGIRITIGIIIFTFIRNNVSRFLFFAGYTKGWVFALFYAQAGITFYVVCMLSDLVGCTWTAIYIWNFFAEKKHPLSKTFGLKVYIILLYIVGIAATIVGYISINGVIDVLDNITDSSIAVYYALNIGALLEMRKLCNEAFKVNPSSSHGYTFQRQ